MVAAVEPTEDLSKYDVAGLRRRFFDEYRSQIESGKFSSEDMRRLKSEDWWCACFLRRYDNDLDVTLPGVAECFKWRHEHRVNVLRPQHIAAHLERGAMALHGSDKEGRPILWFYVRNHRRDHSYDGRQVMIYWLERHFMESKGSKMILLFDMYSTGLQNMDLDLIKFLLHCAKLYYPGILAYLLVFDIPWVLNAAWKLIKTWLDSSDQKSIIFVNTSTIQQHIDQKWLPRHMGGLDEYRFDFSELAEDAEDVASVNSQLDDAYEQILRDRSLSPDPNAFAADKRKQVTFADEEEEPPSEPFLRVPDDSPPAPKSNLVVKEDAPHRENRRDSESGQISKQLSSKAKQLVDQRSVEVRGTPTSGDYAAICPQSELVFQLLPGEVEHVDVVAIRNVYGDKPVAFKVKTTAPEKFRVRPSSGIVQPFDTGTVKIFTQAGYAYESVRRDKFLVLTAPFVAVGGDPAADLAAFWKQASKETICQHRLRIRFAEIPAANSDGDLGALSGSQYGAGTLGNNSGAIVDRTQMERIEFEQQWIKWLLVAVCVLLFVVLLSQRSLNSSVRQLANQMENENFCRKQ